MHVNTNSVASTTISNMDDCLIFSNKYFSLLSMTVIKEIGRYITYRCFSYIDTALWICKIIKLKELT